ncbi:MAG: sulfur oxidation c-type cytochrome SoxA [Hyphomicrobiales bacterium]|nr:sulfur oxidation c-type cytochrome SoxA [Hyphomicrobiales bacterium]
MSACARVLARGESRRTTSDIGEDVPVKLRCALLILACTLLACTLASFGASAQDSDTEKAIEKYRQMLKDDPWSNPALLDADRGEALWSTPRGPKNVSLERCDLGKGPGRVEGAFAELPRYFQDADRVMDLESRILWCMQTLQGFNRADLIKRPHPGGGQPVKELGAMATYVASKSSGMKLAAKLDHLKEKETIALGETLFYRRSGPFDFACATCHEGKGLRIRLQGLPQLANPEEARKVVGEWPAYRVSSTHVMTMQHRMYDCYWQMRMPELELGSEVSIALITFLTSQAEGGEIAAPGLKR